MDTWTSKVKGRLGFGCMRFPKKEGSIDLYETSRMIDLFLEAGFNYFDTARPYLDGMSETTLRECLVKRHPRESFFVTDKLSTMTWDNEDEIDSVLDSELISLGVDHMDMLLMHAQNVATYEKYQRHHAYEHAAAFKAAGKTCHVGISFHDSPEVLERILDDHPEIEAVQIQFNYADMHNGAVKSLGCYEVCERRGIPAIVMGPVKGGNLVELPAEAQAIIDKIPNPEDLSNAGLALRFAASFSNNRVILSGMSDLNQLQDNIRSMIDPVPLTAEQMATLEKVHDIFNELGMIECTSCHYCTPGCPQQIMIPEMLGVLNTKRVFGGWNPGWYYDNSLIGSGHGRASDCTECGLCEKACPQKLSIRDLLKEVCKEFD